MNLDNVGGGGGGTLLENVTDDTIAYRYVTE